MPKLSHTIAEGVKPAPTMLYGIPAWMRCQSGETIHIMSGEQSGGKPATPSRRPQKRPRRRHVRAQVHQQVSALSAPRALPPAPSDNQQPKTGDVAETLPAIPGDDSHMGEEPEHDVPNEDIAVVENISGEPAPSGVEQAGRRFPTLANMAAKAPQSTTPDEATTNTPRELQTSMADSSTKQADDPAVGNPKDDQRGVASSPQPVNSRGPRRPTAPPEKSREMAMPAFPRSPLELARVRPLPEVHLAVPVAGLHAAIAAVVAILGAALLLGGSVYAYWVLVLSALSGIGAGLAYLFGLQRNSFRLAGVALVVSELAILGWANYMLGGDDALLVIGVAVVLVALRTTGRGGAVFAAIGALAIQTVFDLQHVFAHALPVVPLEPLAYAIVSGSLTAVGLLCVVWLAMGLFTGRARHEHVASARQYELHALRSRTSETLRAQEENVARLQRCSIWCCRRFARAARSGRLIQCHRRWHSCSGRAIARAPA